MSGITVLAASPNVDALVEALAGAEHLLSEIVTAIANAKADAGTSRSEAAEARLHSLVEELAHEYDVAVVGEACLTVPADARELVAL